MRNVNEVAENIYLIDNQLLSIPQMGSVYLLNEEKKALIESGPTTSANAVLDGIREVGVRPEDIVYIIVTHVHLDHAGGAGVLLKSMPQAQVVVHHKGAKHLVDPARLISMTVEAQGQEAVARHGEVVPIERHRLQAVHDDDIIKLGEKQVLRFIDAPGHAPHELCISESRNGGLFTGDAAGLFIDGISLPAPNANPELCITTLRRLVNLNATIIYFSHFGTSDKVQEFLQLAIDQLQVWDDIVINAFKENMFDSAAEKLIAQACAKLEPIKGKESLYEYLTEAHIPLCATGHVEYYQEKLGR